VSDERRSAGRVLERDREIAAISAKLDAACDGNGALMVLEGPAGIGKTALLREAVRLANERGMLALRARGGMLEQSLEYGIVRQLVERVVVDAPAERRQELLAGPAASAAIALGLSEPEPDAGPGSDAAGNLQHGLHWLVANLAAEQPVLLAVDDAQWGDFASLRAGGYLAQRLDGLPAVMIVSVRDDDPGPAAQVLRDMLGAAYPTYLNPGPLSEEASAAILRNAFGSDVPSQLAAACRQASGGNPFFLTELAAELSQSGRSATEISPASVDRAGPLAVRRSILLRIGQLGPAARATAEAVAIFGGECEATYAAAISGLEHEAVAAAADQLADAGILERTHPLRIRQPLVRAAIEEDIGPSERAAAHRRAFIILRAAGANADTLVGHALRAEPAGDEKLAELLRRTADRALRTGNAETAAKYLKRALSEGGGDDAGRGELLAELGRAEVRQGAFEDGLLHLDGALQLLDEPSQRLGAQRDQAFAAFASAGMDDARERVRAILEALPADQRESDDALQLRADISLLEWLSGLELTQDLDRYRDVPGETAAERTMLAILAEDDVCARNDPESGIALAERALGRGRMIAEDTSESLGWYLATYALLAVEALDPARATIAEAIADSERRGSAFGRAGALGCRAVLALNQGRPRDAEADARAAAAGGLPPTMILANHAYIALALIDQGDLEGARAEIAAGGFEHGPGGPTVMRWAPWARARLHEMEGDVRAVRTDVQPLIEDEEGGVPMRNLTWRPLLARTLARQVTDGRGAGSEAMALAAESLSWAQGWNRPGVLGTAQRAAALVAPAEERAALMAEAVETLASSALRTEEGRARTDLGVALLRGGKRRDGRTELEKALEIVSETGDRPLAERIAEELEVAGAAPKRLAFDEMTASERRVAELAAAGKTNREIAAELFVTPKTVENHLTRVYAKLGVSSRGALSGSI
jgi:hypothetical protein